MKLEDFLDDFNHYLNKEYHKIKDFDAFEEVLHSDEGQELYSFLKVSRSVLKIKSPYKKPIPKEVSQRVSNAFYHMAFDKFKKKDYNEALNLCRLILDSRPDDINVLYLLFILYLMLGDFENACKTVYVMHKKGSEAVQTAKDTFYSSKPLPQNTIDVVVENLLNRADNHIQGKKFDRAIECYKGIFCLKPDNGEEEVISHKLGEHGIHTEIVSFIKDNVQEITKSCFVFFKRATRIVDLIYLGEDEIFLGDPVRGLPKKSKKKVVFDDNDFSVELHKDYHAGRLIIKKK